jgi:hypothetical protein
MDDQTPPRHPSVLHPVDLRIVRHRSGMSWTGRLNDYAATHLAAAFGVAWTIWVFFTVPLVAWFLPRNVQAHVFFFSSGWIQLFALPLMVYVGNKLQRSSDAQSQVIFQAMTHIATVSDQVAARLDPGTPGSLATVHDELNSLRADISGLAETVRAALLAQPARKPRAPKGAT